MIGDAVLEEKGAAVGNVSIRPLQTEDRAAWDVFVRETCEEATFFHLSGWKEVLERAFGHRTHFLLAEADGVIEGVLPLGHLRSLLFGNALISNPFCVYGGVAAITDRAREALTRAAIDKADGLGVDYLEFRNRQDYHPDWPQKDLYVTFRKSLQGDPEQNLLAIPRKQRAMVRKGIKAGLTSVVDPGVERFYLAYSTSVRNLGTPVFSLRFFEVLREVFGEDCEVLTVELDGRTVASVMSFYFRDEVLPYYGGGTDEARRVKGNDFMYWELMRRASERGLVWFDFGRSKEGTGSYSFKKNWGFEPESLHYSFHLVGADQLPDVNPLNPKYQMFINLWRRLPLWASQRLGPFISRNLG